MNEQKTKYMKIGNEAEQSEDHLRTQNYKFEAVTTLNYLGVILEQTHKPRLKERIDKAYQTYG